MLIGNFDISNGHLQQQPCNLSETFLLTRLTFAEKICKSFAHTIMTTANILNITLQLCFFWHPALSPWTCRAEWIDRLSGLPHNSQQLPFNPLSESVQGLRRLSHPRWAMQWLCPSGAALSLPNDQSWFHHQNLLQHSVPSGHVEKHERGSLSHLPQSWSENIILKSTQSFFFTIVWILVTTISLKKILWLGKFCANICFKAAEWARLRRYCFRLPCLHESFHHPRPHLQALC